MKNKIVCACLLLTLLCAASVQAARPQKRNTADDEYAQQNSHKFSTSDFSKALNYYIAGNLEKAELILNEILLVNPDYTDALELKNKILIVKEKLFVFKRDTAEDYIIESERSLRDGNFYEGLLYYKRAVELLPEIYDAHRYNTIIGELNAQSLRYRGGDRKKFLYSVESFQDGNFRRAKALVDDLSHKYNHMRDYRGVTDFFMIEYTNKDRVNHYYKEALSNFKKGRFENARVMLDYAKAIDNKDSEIALLSEQIDLEIQ